MKKIYSFPWYRISPLLFLAFLFLAGCGTANNVPSKRGASSDPNALRLNEAQAETTTWSNLLRRIPGVDVRGTDPDLTIRVRGDKSVSYSMDPLYVLDGVPLGHDFSSLEQTILPINVQSVRVLKGASASIYGARGLYGVIVVKSKE